ncbi:MAG: hypothetical protein EOO73_24270 [Myxococcales bacterium]|nr:MAG: hypothetical protein EOO73_24270 [Myxococcales bacterium]
MSDRPLPDIDGVPPAPEDWRSMAATLLRVWPPTWVTARLIDPTINLAVEVDSIRPQRYISIALAEASRSSCRTVTTP